MDMYGPRIANLSLIWPVKPKELPTPALKLRIKVKINYFFLLICKLQIFYLKSSNPDFSSLVVVYVNANAERLYSMQEDQIIKDCLSVNFSFLYVSTILFFIFIITVMAPIVLFF